MGKSMRHRSGRAVCGHHVAPLRRLRTARLLFLDDLEHHFAVVRDAAALRMVRIDFAVRPCFPMMRPRSSLATFSSSTEAVSPRLPDLDRIGIIDQLARQKRTSSFM
jgi:hypothetical protein